jgi:hypothetical protein
MVKEISENVISSFKKNQCIHFDDKKKCKMRWNNIKKWLNILQT